MSTQQGRADDRAGQLHRLGGVLLYGRRALALVWQTSPGLTLALATFTVLAGALPALAAWIGQLIVDAVVAALALHREGQSPELGALLWLVAAEGGVMALLSAAQRGTNSVESLLRALLGQRVNVMILEKAQQLSLVQFEDSEFYDRLTRARREASTRPLALVRKTFGLIQNAVALVSAGVLLLQLSPWAVVILVVAGLPSFIAEARFSGDAFRLFRWRSPERRMQLYLETVLAREDSIKEVKLFGLGPLLLDRYRSIFDRLYRADRNLTLRRDGWGLALGLISTATFYGAYAWVVLTTATGRISLGQMTMYLMLFRQGQAAVAAALSAISGMYEDNLYISTLYEYLEQPVPEQQGDRRQGDHPGEGVVFEDVWFRYPGADEPALQGISLRLRPGQSLALVGDNGAGKTTLVKLLTRLYEPERGRILLDGTDLQQWHPEVLRQRIGVIFQDFVRYQFLVGENIGAGDVERFEERARWQQAAEKGLAAEFVETLPQGYDTQLGRWFAQGRELSGGQWQKIALARAFMRSEADILVLDEPTAAMDAEAEATIFEHFRQHCADRMAILISHRFSTVRMADQIAVLQHGRIIEQGSHEELLAAGGRYAELFQLQAAGYR